MTDTHILSIISLDAGTSSVRTLLFDGEGRELDGFGTQIPYQVATTADGGVEVDAETLVPTFDPESCETNVAGLYVAGTIQAGRSIDRIFIENSREHGPKIVAHLCRRLGAAVREATFAGR